MKNVLTSIFNLHVLRIAMKNRHSVLLRRVLPWEKLEAVKTDRGLLQPVRLGDVMVKGVVEVLAGREGIGKGGRNLI